MGEVGRAGGLEANALRVPYVHASVTFGDAHVQVQSHLAFVLRRLRAHFLGGSDALSVKSFVQGLHEFQSSASERTAAA